MMALDIIFQNGEFQNEGGSFWADFFINVLGALIGTITALYIFRETVRTDVNKEKAKERRVIEQRLHYFSSLVDSICKTSVNQIPHIKLFFEAVKSNPTYIPLLTFLPTNDFKRFSEITNHEDYYHAYLQYFDYTPETVIEYRKYYKIVDYLYAQSLQMEEILKTSMNFDFERKTQYQNIVDNAMNLAAKMGRMKSEDVDTQNFYQMMGNTIADFHQSQPDYANLKEFQEKFVIKVITEILDKFLYVDAAFPVLTELKNASSLYENIKVNNLTLAENFDGIYDEYSASYSKLSELNEKLKSKPVLPE